MRNQLKKNMTAWRNMYRLAKLDYKFLHDNSRREVDVIVSLTTIPSRLRRVRYTILSILNQSLVPKKIVLWLHESLKSQIPSALLELQGTRFDIKYTSLDSPHCKLVPSLIEYPNDIIVTSDDDLMYASDWLEGLWQSHLVSPNDIIANRFRLITKDHHGVLRPYKQWSQKIRTTEDIKHSIPLGFAGVLYPPSSLDSDVINSDTYLQLSPKADDLWFKAMSFLQKTNISENKKSQCLYSEIPGSQKISLRHENIRQDFNVEQWKRLCIYYPGLKNLGVNL